jgi:deoxyxylulose-5-phosphate synthase
LIQLLLLSRALDSLLVDIAILDLGVWLVVVALR